MSADYAIVGGLVLLPVAAAILPVVGAGYAIYKGVQFEERQREERRRRKEEERRVQEHILQQQNEAYYSSMLEMYDSYNSLSQSLDMEAERLNRKKAEALSKIYDSYLADLRCVGDLHGFEYSIRKKQSDIERVYREEREAAFDTFRKELEDVFKRISKNIDSTEEGLRLLESINMEDNREKDFVENIINKAKASIELLRAEINYVPELLLSELNESIRYYNADEFEISYSKASGIVLSCLQRLEDARKKKAEFFIHIDELEKKISIIEDRLKMCRSIRFEWEGELIEEDLFRFESTLFEGVSSRFKLLKDKCNACSGYMDGLIDDIKMLLVECETLDLDVLSVCKYAAAKMVFAYSENDNAEIITDILEEQGFHLIDSAYESDSEGNPLHINFINEITSERLTAVLSPTDGGIQIDVHNYGNDLSGNGNINTQTAVQNALKKAMNKEGVCHKLGGISTNSDASDLSTVKNRSVEHSAVVDVFAQNM